MKSIILIFSLVLSSGCAYCGNRQADIKDILTCSIGSGVGAAGRIGPIGTGLGFYKGKTGLTGGDFYYLNSKGDSNYVGPSVKDTNFMFVIFGLDGVSGVGNSTLSSRKKEYNNKYLCFVSFPGTIMSNNGAEISPAYYTQLEGHVSIGGGIKFGINPGELLDFLLGFMLLDIYSDDIEK